MQLLNHFKEHWQRTYNTDAACLLAVSGGADSMAMACLFEQAGIAFAVAHCNFGLRGTESDGDEAFVSAWCHERNITCHVQRFDTKEHMHTWKKGVQETARILRYEWFDELRKAHGYAAIATAHHANDNVETMLMNLFRGTGISGLHGIPGRNGHIIRPLLFATRDQLRGYLSERGQGYREDASNDSDDYLRNAVRHKLVPVAEELFPGVVTQVNESIARFAEAETLYKRTITQERKKLLERRGNDYYIPVRKLRLRTPLFTICYELLQPFGFTSKQVTHVLDLMDAESGHYVSSSTHRVLRNRDFLVITALPDEEADMVLIEALPCTVIAGSYRYHFQVKAKPPVLPTDANVACIDLKHITLPCVLRTRRTGDYLYPLGMGMKKKKVSRLLIDQKTGLHEKEQVRILECGKKIAWVAGLRLDERFKVKADTAQVLMVTREALP